MSRNTLAILSLRALGTGCPRYGFERRNSILILPTNDDANQVFEVSRVDPAVLQAFQQRMV
jgi:hypothetical protein